MEKFQNQFNLRFPLFQITIVNLSLWKSSQTGLKEFKPKLNHNINISLLHLQKQRTVEMHIEREKAVAEYME